MTDKIIPDNAKKAAARGFIRTASQSLATGFAVPGGLTLVFTGDGLLALGVGVLGLLFNALVNGAQSYFSILSAGIPEEYASRTLTADELEADYQARRALDQ